MPRVVREVPNPWAPYMDGQIWEFTQEEWRQMPGYRPIVDNTMGGEIVSSRQMIWTVNGKVYTRFFRPDHVMSREDIEGIS